MTWAIIQSQGYTRAITELLTEASKPSGSERVMAVVGGALLEEAVEVTVKHRFLNEPTITKLLLGPERALGNISPQIDLLYLLGAFDEKTRKAMKGLARVRNFFAHHTEASFDSLHGDFLEAIKPLNMHEGRTHYPHHLWGPESQNQIEPVNTRRDLFVVNLKLALILLMRDRISHEDYSNRPRSDAEKKERWPERYAETHGS